MLATVRQYLEGMASERDRRSVRVPLSIVGDRLSSQPLVTAGLVIKAGGSTLAKTGGSAFYATVAGRLVTIAASTDMPALTGISNTAAYYNVACFFVDGSGTTSVAGGTQATTLGGVIFPNFPYQKALIGFLIITYASAFVGGTTPLDTATTVYVSPIGAFDPTVLGS